ncbi:hypothetical protein OPQ81_001336 [Rhizoctonia solani]|nr:hypothetical protein OPQ81_001336 [Rhizoctonia solani]
MSAEYDDDAEYAMHDITEATANTNDEEIYDAEFEEAPEHTEIEMDEYADEVEVVEDDETQMGTYVPTDDAATVTDVTVEDVQLRSSPVPAGLPQEGAIPPISPHVPVDADLSLNEPPAGALADHSPHSVATLVGDSETEHPQVDTSKDGPLNEAIDLTENDEQPRIVTIEAVEETTSVNPIDLVDQVLPQSGHEITQDAPDEAEHEIYDTEEPTTELSSINPAVPNHQAEEQEDQLEGEQEDEQDPGQTDQHQHIVEAPTHLEIPEQTDQDGHSPIEEALVINQQVRDDAADSMEPSPPVRLYYRDESKGTDGIFEIFASTGLESHEAILLFHDNRTLFYEPLSTFFSKLRETEYFSGDGWENAEMGVRMDLGDLSISINEDHKETENISLFKLSFIWSGLGLQEPLELTLVRLSERFVVQLARIVEQAEQRDLHDEDAAVPPEGHHEAETGGLEINPGDTEDDESDVSEPTVLENNSQQNEHRAPINREGTPDDTSRRTHESKDAQALDGVQPERLDEQRQEVDGNDRLETARAIGADNGPEATVQDTPTHHQDPTTQPENIDDQGEQGTEAEGIDPSPEDDDDNTVSNGQSPNTPTLQPQEDEYDEYEAEGASDSAPTQKSAQTEASNVGWDAHEYDYDEDYEGADEEHGESMPPDNTLNELKDSEDPPPHPSVPKLQGHDSLQNAGLKRNLEELEYEEYETPSAPSSPDYKRVKHV